MDLIEEIGKLTIFHIFIPLILGAIAIHKINKMRKRKRVKNQEIPVKPTIQQPSMIEPVSPEGLKINTTPEPLPEQQPPSKPEPPILYAPEEGTILWNRVLMVLAVIILFIFSIGFVWGVYNDKFKTSSNIDIPSCPNIEIPECPVCPELKCAPPVPCPPCNVSVGSPIVNVYYNLTNSSI